MLFDESWHSSRPLDSIRVGDTLKVANGDTLEVMEWEVTSPAVSLSPEEAMAEWRKYPFGAESFAKKNGYYPHVLRNLRKIAAYPPQLPSPRYIPSVVRRVVFLRDKGECRRCGGKSALQFDHIVPVSKGGSNTEDNVELLCRECNARKSDRVE